MLRYLSHGITPLLYAAAAEAREPLLSKEAHKSKRRVDEADPAILAFLCRVSHWSSYSDRLCKVQAHVSYYNSSNAVLGQYGISCASA